MPEWEKHGLAQWKQIKWACQTSRFVRNKKKTLFYIKCSELRTNRIAGGNKKKENQPLFEKERMNISAGELSPHSNPLPSGVTRVNNAVSVRGQACLFITAAGL